MNAFIMIGLFFKSSKNISMTPTLFLQLPRHVGLIMDGNARWANRHGLPRQEGHRRGMEAMCAIIHEATRLHIPNITFYCFSIENQARPQEEVDHIMKLGIEFMQTQATFLLEESIRFRMIGERGGLPAQACEAISILEEKTAHGTGLQLTCAINYGGRQEIIQAITTLLALKGADEKNKRPIGEQFEDFLETATLPEVDLIIRTSGEKRLSNFLLWQAAYSELAFTDVLWPDFTPGLFQNMLIEYSQRQRRFGRRLHYDQSWEMTS